MRFTPNGTFIQAAGGSGGGGGSYSDNGCWKLVRETSGETSTLKFENQFYQIGGQIHEGSDNTDMYTFIKQGELSEGQEYTSSDKPYIYLVVYATSANGSSAGEMEIRGKKEWSELMADADNQDLYVKPLYKLTHDGGIAIDFRNMPQLVMNEIVY